MAYQSYDDAMLLKMIHEALKKWKNAEGFALAEQTDVLVVRNKIRAAALRNIYIELLREARKRDLSLTTEQLLDRILYTYM